jgi:hypothetical protein
MPLDTIDRAEFDRRLELSTARMRQQRLTLEAQAAELEPPIARYSAVLERLEAETVPACDAGAQRRSELRNIQQELAERTSAVAAAL